jgi:hypothetical protein
MDSSLFKNKLMMLSHILNQELRELDQMNNNSSKDNIKAIKPSNNFRDFKVNQDPTSLLQISQLPSPDSQTSAASYDDQMKPFKVFHTQPYNGTNHYPDTLVFEAEKHASYASVKSSSSGDFITESHSLPNIQRSRSTSTLKRGKICSYCGCEETPMWRNGPTAFKVLCNK